MHRGWAALGLLVAPVALALQVAPGSPCAGVCLDDQEHNPWSAADSNTNSSDITCSDASYSSTKVGIHYKTCLDCLRTSSRGNMGETDAKWFVYNLRYSLDVCLFSKPAAADNTKSISCASNDACKRLEKSLTSDNLTADQSTSWDYCFADDGKFMGKDRATCAQCLRQSDDQKYLANFLVGLEAGCRQTPEKGTAMGLNSTLFTTDPVAIVDPESLSYHANGPSLPAPAIAGIAVGVFVLILIAIGLFITYFQKEKKRPRWEDEWYYGQADVPRAPAVSPLRKRRSHVAYPLEKVAPPGSNGNYYDTMESRLRSEDKAAEMFEITNLSSKRTSSNVTSEVALPAHPAYNPYTATSRNTAKARDISSPDMSLQRPVRSNTPDSFAEQAYMAAAEDSARLAISKKSPTSSHHPSQASHSRTSVRRTSGFLSILPKSLSPKFSRNTQDDGPGLVAKSPQGDPQISGPMLHLGNTRRFEETPQHGPVTGPVVYATHAPPRPPSDYEAEYREVPLKSGKNDLYGI